MVRVTHFSSLLLFLSPGAIPITRETEETPWKGYFGKRLHSLPCPWQCWEWLKSVPYERTGHWTSCLAARKSASPTGSGGCWQRWPRASNEEKGESTWKEVVWVFSDRETCEKRSASASWQHIRCKSRKPHPQPPDLETLGLFPRMNTSSLFWILLFVPQPLAFPWHAALSRCQGAPDLFCKVQFLAPPIKPAPWSLRKPMALMVAPQVLPSLSVLRNNSYRELNHQ